VKTIVAQGEGKRIEVEVADNLTNAEAARKAAEALGATAGRYSWEGRPFVVPKAVVKNGQVFLIRIIAQPP
jgi:hypothetical protein